MLLAVEVAETFLEHATLWAIRLAMLAMFVCFALELRGWRQLDSAVRGIWLLGAVCSFLHSLGALLYLHDGSHDKAFESTAKQTEDLLGVAVGVGLYVNYLFVAVWSTDAVLRCVAARWYTSVGRWYHVVVYGFLGFIAINGTIVFKGGWVREIGILAVLILLALASSAFLQKNRLGVFTKKPRE